MRAKEEHIRRKRLQLWRQRRHWLGTLPATIFRGRGPPPGLVEPAPQDWLYTRILVMVRVVGRVIAVRGLRFPFLYLLQTAIVFQLVRYIPD